LKTGTTPQPESAAPQKAFSCLLRLFVGRMFHGGEVGNDDLDLGVGISSVLLAMPGLLVSLLLFEKYSSLVHFMMGDVKFDPFRATIPDEYFFIALSMAVTGLATLWKWTAIFPDRRDFANLVHLPLSLGAILVANFAAIGALASLFAVVANAPSIILFPIVVAGSQGSLQVFVRFFVGHALTVIAAGLFSFCLVFMLTGTLLALFPYGISRRVATIVRFFLIVLLLALIASSLSVPDLLANSSATPHRFLGALPPVWFLGLSQLLWGRGPDTFFSEMAGRAAASLIVTSAVAILASLAGFRRSFQKIPEFADLPLVPSLSSLHLQSFRGNFYRAVFGNSTRQALGRFVIQALARSEAHQQVLLFSVAIGVVASAKVLTNAPLHAGRPGNFPLSAELLSVPLILACSVIVGIRFCFEIPLSLPANWIFRFWIDPKIAETRSTARRLLLLLSLSWIAPFAFVLSGYLWGLFVAALHTLVLVACSVLVIEISILRFRKIPFTCSYPPFQSHSPLLVVAYLFGILVVTSYVPESEKWVIGSPWITPLLFLPAVLILAGLSYYRKNMLPMDKELIFEEPPTHWS
jgi:hypothetical protein